MKRNNKKIIITILIIVSIFTIFFASRIYLTKKEDKLPEVRLKEIKSNKSFAIMIENTNGEGYMPYEGEKWPTDENDYFYSHAECINNNGQKQENAIIYNGENQTVELSTNQTLYCTLYFNKYNYMKVVNSDIPVNGYTVPVYVSAKIRNVYFVDYIKEDLEEGQYWDLSDTSHGTPIGSVIAWGEPIQGDVNYNNLYIGSKTKIRAISLSTLFSASEYVDNTWISNLETINFNNMLDTSKTIDMYGMFFNCNKLTDIKGLDNWDVTNVKSMQAMFCGCSSLTNINFVKNWNLASLQNMVDMFGGCKNLVDITPLENWNVSNVESMYQVFRECIKLTDISALSKWNTRNVTTMQGMFFGTAITNLDALSSWQTPNLTNIQQLCWNCSKLKSASGINNLASKNLRSMDYAFTNCPELTTVNLSLWDTSNVESMQAMFNGCTSLQTIDMRNAQFDQIITIDGYKDLFTFVPSTAVIIVKDNIQRTWLETYPTFPGIIKTPFEL